MPMGKSNISEQAENYAEVIVGQIAGNFTALHDVVDANEEVKETRKNFRASLPSNTNGKDFVEKIIDKTFSKPTTVLKLLEAQDRLTKAEEKKKKYSTYEPLAVGLFGEWGSGKTYQLKLIEEKLNTNPLQDNGWYTVPVFFNAWRFEKEEHIILPLFQTLLSIVDTIDRDHETTENIQKSWRSLKVQLKSIKASMLDGFGMPESISNTLLDVAQGNLVEAAMSIYDVKKVLKKSKALSSKKLVGDQSLTQLLKPDQLESIYLNIPKWIEEITLLHQVNFVFLIDDLDRCLPENTLKMLESIKLFLDVPSCAFVLAVDDDVVERGVVHHYRDYLSIYHSKDTEDAKGAMQHELPITGHEYLEKMIQLPIRLPVIDTVNVRAFLEEHSSKWIDYLPNELRNERKHTMDMTSVPEDKPKEPYERLLDFFESKIPPKPRKIKRTALLFHSKLQLFDGMKIECHDMYILVAKITLLELFAPKLLRFIQNNGYDSMYNRLVEFKEQEKSLTEFQNIKEYIERKVPTDKSEIEKSNDVKKIDEEIENDKDYYTQKEQQLYTRMMYIVKEHYTSRIQFDLDMVFTANEDKEDLQKIIEMREKDKSVPKATHELKGNAFLEKLFKEDDIQSWRDAFKVDKLFEEGKATLTDTQLTNIMKLAKEKGLHKNYEWRNAIIPYVAGEQLIDAEIYFEMSPTTVTKGEFKAFVDDTEHKTDAEQGKGMYVYNGKGWEQKKDASWKNSYIKDETDEHPVVGVSWNDAKAYIAWKNKNDSDYDYVLPTEDEWYLACNNGKDTKWHFGDDESQLIKYAWYNKNSDMRSHKVKEKEANSLNLYDMHGNVWEWCEDWYDEDKDTKVLRGGSWDDSSNDSGSTFRDGGIPTSSYSDVGFRLQRTLSS